MSQSHFKTTLQNKLWLVQTDTTVGFLSQDYERLARLKERPPEKPFVRVGGSFKTVKKLTRIPKQHAKVIRRSKRTTFVYPNNLAIRVAQDEIHSHFLKPFEWFYSTSANEKGLHYEPVFAFEKSDIILEDARGLYEGIASRIYRLEKHKMTRLR